MPRKKKVKHDEIIEIWHSDPYRYKPDSREAKLIRALCREENFNSLFSKSYISDEPNMVSTMF